MPLLVLLCFAIIHIGFCIRAKSHFQTVERQNEELLLTLKDIRDKLGRG